MKKSILANTNKVDQLDQTQKKLSLTDQQKKVVINEPKQKEDQYVEKLNAHISFLAKAIRDMKKRQDDYKNGMVDLLSKDAKALPDLASESQQKFKEMKQGYNFQINDLENKTCKSENQNEGLIKKKEKSLFYLNQLEELHNKMDAENKQIIYEMKEKWKKEKEKRENLEEELEKAKQAHDRYQQEYEQRFKEIKEKEILDQIEQKRYQQDLNLEIKDLNRKIELHKEILKEIEKLKLEQEQDYAYAQLVQENQRLSEDLKALTDKYEKERYRSLELEQLVNFGEQEKEKEGQLKVKLREELEKQQSILEEYLKKNKEKIEKKFEYAECPKLLETQKNYNKIEREAKEIFVKFQQNDVNFKKLKIEQMKREVQLDKTKKILEANKAKYSALLAQYNSKDVEYKELMTKIDEHEQRLATLYHKNQELTKNNQRLSIKSEYLEARYKHYEKNVNLNDYVSQWEFQELERTQQSNIQFVDSLKNLKMLKEEVRQNNMGFNQQ